MPDDLAEETFKKSEKALHRLMVAEVDPSEYWAQHLENSEWFQGHYLTSLARTALFHAQYTGTRFSVTRTPRLEPSPSLGGVQMLDTQTRPS